MSLESRLIQTRPAASLLMRLPPVGTIEYRERPYSTVHSPPSPPLQPGVHKNAVDMLGRKRERERRRGRRGWSWRREEEEEEKKEKEEAVLLLLHHHLLLGGLANILNEMEQPRDAGDGWAETEQHFTEKNTGDAAVKDAMLLPLPHAPPRHTRPRPARVYPPC